MARQINKFGLFVVLFIALTLLYILTKGYDIDYGVYCFNHSIYHLFNSLSLQSMRSKEG